MNGALLPLAAVGAGALSALSPCVLPVIPGYLATVSTAQSNARGTRGRPSLIGTAGFVAGFTVVFTLLGATASALGAFLFDRVGIALDLAGVLLIVMGLHSIGLLRLGSLTRDRRPIDVHRVGSGPRRAVLLGAVFAFGWTPCIGPILATILTKAAADASLSEGFGLLLLYSAGLGTPFVAIALWFDRSEPVRHWLQRRTRQLQQLGGGIMILVGVGYISGAWSTVFGGVQGWLTRTGWPPF